MTQVPTSPEGGVPVPPFDAQKVHSQRITAGILGIVLGGVAAHRFYLGDTKGGIIRVVVCCSGFGIISIVEGIMYLTKTDEQFYQEYIVNKKEWF